MDDPIGDMHEFVLTMHEKQERMRCPRAVVRTSGKNIDAPPQIVHFLRTSFRRIASKLHEQARACLVPSPVWHARDQLIAILAEFEDVMPKPHDYPMVTKRRRSPA